MASCVEAQVAVGNTSVPAGSPDMPCEGTPAPETLPADTGASSTEKVVSEDTNAPTEDSKSSSAGNEAPSEATDTTNVDNDAPPAQNDGLPKDTEAPTTQNDALSKKNAFPSVDCDASSMENQTILGAPVSENWSLSADAPDLAKKASSTEDNAPSVGAKPLSTENLTPTVETGAPSAEDAVEAPGKPDEEL
ncbi:brain acid soluble protein 1-like [Eleutherodactylus coqui]|uniref:brain acid soluble protein 1-like n=1 Tax=Eleutherodactylus coqui TaxID=57060 RepID=UPI0034637822